MVTGNIFYHFTVSSGTAVKTWLQNYGWVSGKDRVYKQPSVVTDSKYYQSNRNGSCVYAFKFLESDVIVDLDFRELWGRKPGQRVFDVQVSWNDGLWVSLGHIDPSLINGDESFSIRLSHQNTHSFAFRLSSIPGTKRIFLLYKVFV